MKVKDSQGTEYEVTVEHNPEQGRSVVKHQGKTILVAEYTSLPELVRQSPTTTTKEQLQELILRTVEEYIQHELEQMTGMQLQSKTPLPL